MQRATAIVILAAGGSRRLGQPKQLVRFGGEALIARAVRTAYDAGCGPVLAVVGASRDSVEAALAPFEPTVLLNPAWERGLGSSIAVAIAALAPLPLRGVIFALCDQPGLTAAHLAELSACGAAGQAIAASAYGDTLGVPAYFARSVFPELAALAGERGARTVIARDPARVLAVPFPAGLIDVDTPEDLLALAQLEALEPSRLFQN